MNTRELYDEIQENLSEENLKGEFTLKGNCIVWLYNLDENSEEIEIPDEDDDEYNYSFESQSAEELLQEAYDEDKELLEQLLDTLNVYDDFTFSEQEIRGNKISFKIF
jgi:hypothetical protein